jgi:uncharacterized protein YjbJ (UPF0337 family)
MEDDMSSATDKAKGYANQAIGKAKEGIGRVTGNENLEAEGDAQQIKGNVQVGIGEIKDAAKEGAKAVDKALNK